MTEMYSQDELARAWGEVDSILGEDYRNERLGKICLQARKNRLWDQQDKIPAWEEDLLREQWKEASEPVVMTHRGPVPFSKAQEALRGQNSFSREGITLDLDGSGWPCFYTWMELREMGLVDQYGRDKKECDA